MRKAEAATQRHAHRFIIRRIDNVRLVAKEITTWLLIIGLLIAGLGVQLFIGQHGYMTQARHAGGLYVEGALGPVNTLNPLYVTTSAESSVSRLLFSSLYNYDATGTLHQDIATGMTINDAHTVYTVTIKDGVKWHDGQPLTAKDIVYTINLIKSPSVRSSLRVNWLDVSVGAINDTTVQFSLPAPYAAFPHALTFPILPQHVLQNIAPSAIRESAFSQAPIGSGPFEFRRLQEADTVSRARVVHMTANSAYYGGTPKLSRFELHAYADEATLLHALTIGEVSGAADVPPSSIADVKKNKSYKITTASLDSGVYLILNTTNPVLKDTKVRQALQLATDTSAIRKAVGGDVMPLDGPILSTQMSGTDIPHAPTIDVKRAGALLDEAGWKMVGSYRVKDGQKLELTITTTQDKEFNLILDKVEAQWRQLGVKVNSSVVDTAKASSTFVQNTLQAKNFDILLYELIIGADPDVFGYWYSGQVLNLANYSNSVSDSLLLSARSRLEPELRNAKYKQFVRQWLADVPAIALYQPTLGYVTNTSVDAIGQGSHLVMSSDRYYNVQYWTLGSESVYKTP